MPRTLYAALALATLLLAASASAQDVVLANVHVPGREAPQFVLIRGGRIARIVPGIPKTRIPIVDGGGGWVVPGRIDAWASVPGGGPLGRALDGFDAFDQHTIREALAQGVTTVCLTPSREMEGVAGVATVIKLKPGVPDPEDLVVEEEAAVCAGLGSPDEAPLVRARRYGKLDQQLREARRYRAAWEDYRESLADYLKQSGADAAAIDSKTGAKKPTPPGPGPKGGGAVKGKRKDAAQGAKEKQKPKRPEQPETLRLMELLGRVLDRELPLRIEAHRAEDVLAALELQSRHGFRLILEGAEEGYRVARTLAGRDDVGLVLGPTLAARPPGGQPLEFDRDRSAPDRDERWSRTDPLRYAPEDAALLQAAGLRPALGTGAWSRSRHVALNAALAVGAGLDAQVAQAGITARAAELLGLGQRLGRVADEYDGDLVVLDGPGLEAQVRLVVVDGVVVYRKEG